VCSGPTAAGISLGARAISAYISELLMRPNTPILIVAWRRPGALEQVIQAIRLVKPTSLFIACDGPRGSNPDDFEKVVHTRQVIDEQIDWECDIQKRYMDINQGCRLGVSSAISWFFEHVQEGIILEDDCVPHPDFFRFCGTLLDRYRDNRKVWCITGDNFQYGRRRGHGSYYFSKYNHIWGWATWRDRWLSYDLDLKFWPSWRDSSHFANMFRHQQERDYWRRIFNDTYLGKIDTWDYQWTACTWRSGGLTATPQVNLVTNIGHGSEGTHTGGDTDARFRIPTGELSRKMRHPWRVRQHKRADLYVHETVFGGADSGTVGMRKVGRRFSSALRLFAGIRPDHP
jgi:hypothetical protein